MINDIPLSEKELCPDNLLLEQEAAFARDIERMHKRSNEYLDVNCPACDKDKAEPIFNKYGFHFVSCSECETIYMTPRPSEAVMTDYYSNSENYAYWAKYIFPASEAARREKIHKPWFARVLDICKKYDVEKDTLVEVGPGFGTFSALAQASNVFEHVIAIEPTPEMANACKERGVHVIEKRIEDASNELSSADVVVSFEVIEHLFSPRQFLEKASALLKPGGILILSCPNGLGFDIDMLGADSLAVDAEHVNLFNPDSLSILIKSCGFDILEVTTPGRLDAEFVREASLSGKFDLNSNPFLKRILIDEWEQYGFPFQQFLAAQGLSSHMWVAARKPE